MMTDVAVLSTAHDVRDARLQRIVQALRRRGLEVTVDARGGTRAALWSPQDGHTAVPGRLARRLTRAVSLPVQHRARVVMVLDPDLVVPAYAMTRLTGSHLVVDVHEDYRAALHDRAWATPALRGLLEPGLGLVDTVAARAEVTVTADEAVPPRSARRRLVVRNLPDVGDLPPCGPPDRTPRAVYVGDLRPSRGLTTMLAAVAAAPGWTLDLVGPVSEISQRDLDEMITDAGLRDRVRCHGRLPMTGAWRVARGAWVGLCMLESTPAYRGAIPTKVWEYLAVGLPVLSTPLPRVRRLLTKTGTGVVARDAQHAARYLRRFASDPARLRAMRARTAPTFQAQHARFGSSFDELARLVAALVGRPEPIGHRHTEARPIVGLPDRTDAERGQATTTGTVQSA